MTKLKFIPVAVAALFSLSAHAVQKDITVVADIDPTLEMTQPDGSALPSTVRMNYFPGQGLQPQSIMTKIFSNDIAKDMELRLVVAPTLAPMTNPAAAAIPLAVKYHGRALSTTPVTLAAADVFLGDAAAGSISMPLEITQQTVGTVAAAASYQGVVSVVLTHSAATP
jgi:hypothetical protein